MWRFWILSPAIFAALLALGSFVVFACRFRRAHPELWQKYRLLFYSTLGSASRGTLLSAEVFSKITDERSRHLRKLHRVLYVVYAVLAIICIVLFVCSFPATQL